MTVKWLRPLPFILLAPFVSGLGWFTAFVLLPVAHARVSHRVLRLWGHALVALAGARLVVVGRENLSPVIVANHSSYLDIPAMTASFPGQLRIVAKRSLLWMPFVGWHLALGGHFLLDREDPREGRKILERAAARLRAQRVTALLFGEGRRSEDGRLAPLKGGTFYLPLAASVPVQPTAILGSHAIMPRGAPGPMRRGTIEVRFGPAIPTAGLSGGPARKTLSAAVRASLLELGVPDGGSSA
jgi:1-acyl-sn-glycerol-3-phosphate acyltransferase